MGDDHANDQELFLWRNDKRGGWHITRHLGDDRWNEDDNVVGWGKTRGGEPQTFPLTYHVPAWSRASSLLVVKSYTRWLEEKVETSEIDIRKNAMRWCDMCAHLIYACLNKEWELVGSAHDSGR